MIQSVGDDDFGVVQRELITARESDMAVLESDATRVINVEGAGRGDVHIDKIHVGHGHFRASPDGATGDGGSGGDVAEGNVAPNRRRARNRFSLESGHSRRSEASDGAGRAGSPVIAVDEHGHLHVGHGNVVIEKVPHQAAAVVVGLQPQAKRAAGERAVGNHEVRNPIA